jgi:hypothetical protein
MKPVLDFRVFALAEIARPRRAGGLAKSLRGFRALALDDISRFRHALEVR